MWLLTVLMLRYSSRAISALLRPCTIDVRIADSGAVRPTLRPSRLARGAEGQAQMIGSHVAADGFLVRAVSRIASRAVSPVLTETQPSAPCARAWLSRSG